MFFSSKCMKLQDAFLKSFSMLFLNLSLLSIVIVTNENWIFLLLIFVQKDWFLLPPTIIKNLSWLALNKLISNDVMTFYRSLFGFKNI